MRKNILWFNLLFVIINGGFSQSVILSKVSVPVYSVINDDFYSILDSFVIHEQQYEYYDTTVIFPITMDIYKDCTMVQLFSGYKRNDSIKILKENINQLLFFHKQHVFIVNVRTSDSEQTLLKETKYKQLVYYVTYKVIKTNNDAIFIDDYWPTTWIYQFKDEIFYEKLKLPLIGNR